MNNELKHYGVLGMKWGVRRTPEQLRAKSGKLQAKNAKLQKKKTILEEKARKSESKNAGYAARLRSQANYNRNKAYSWFTSERKAASLEYKARKLEARANNLESVSKELRAKAKSVEARMQNNEDLIKIYNSTANALDSGKIVQGNRFVDKFFMQYEDDRY